MPAERDTPPNRLAWVSALVRRAVSSDVWAAAAVALLALAVYANSLPGIFFLDDDVIVRDSPLVTGHAFRRILTSDYWWNNFSGLYRPLTVASYAVNHVLFGPGALSFHLVNLTLNAAVCVLFHLFLRTLVPARLTAFAAASLFAVHPIHAEAVVTVVGRAELLAALFVFAGLLSDAAFPRARAWLCPLCLALAVLSKESGLVLLALIPLADSYRRGSIAESLRSRRRSYVVLILVALAWFLWRRHVLPGDTLLLSPPLVTDNPLLAMPLEQRVLTALGVQLRYLVMLAAPFRLRLVYDGTDVAPIEFASPAGLGVVAAVAALTTLACILWKRRHPGGFALPLYAVAASPTSNIFVPIAIVLAERVAYLPSAGFCLGVAALAAGADPRRPVARAGAALIAVYGLILAGATVARNPDFGRPIRIWERATQTNPSSARAWWYLGAELQRAGRLEEAKRAYVRGANADPRFLENWSSLTGLSLDLEDPLGALGFAAGYSRFGPAAQPDMNIMMARAEVMLGRPQRALALLDAIEPYLVPERPRTRQQYLETRGVALEELGRADAALDCYRRVLDSTMISRIPIRYARLLLAAGRAAEAEEAIRRAARRFENPEFEALLNAALAQQGKPPATLRTP